jgi:lipopolysaccharide transport system permease protein
MTALRVITSKPKLFPDLREAWEHRALALMLTRRNIKIRYRQTLLGSIWIIIQPILITGALTVVGGTLLAAPSQGLPYPLFAFTGMMMWSLFQRTLTDTSTSLAASGAIILKVYFPRIIIPISTALTAAFDLIPVFALMILFVLYYGLWPGWLILFSPFILLVALILAFAIGLWVTMLDAIYRDVRLIVPSVLQIVFYLTPVMYAESAVPHRLRALYNVNPIVNLERAFRWSTVAGLPPPSSFDIFWSLAITLVTLLVGLYIFARLEQYAVDKI